MEGEARDIIIDNKAQVQQSCKYTIFYIEGEAVDSIIDDYYSIA